MSFLVNLKKQIAMSFTNIQELYDYLENNVSQAMRRATLTRDIHFLADKTDDERIKAKIKFETYVFDFVLEGGKAKPVHASSREDGIEYTYPSYSDFENDGINYLIERAAVVKNDFLIARYNQILWNSPKPHKQPDHAKATIDAYLRLLIHFDWKKDDDHSYEYFEIFKNAFPIAIQVKYKIEEYKKLIHSWLFEESKFSDELKPYLIRYMLEQSEFVKNDFDDCLELINQIGEQHSKVKTDYYKTKDIYETGLLIAQRLNSNTKIWNEKIGDAIVRMAEYRMDDESRMIPLGYYHQSIPFYKAAGLPNKVKEIEQKFYELKSQLKLSKFELPLDDKYSDFVENYLNAKVESVLAGTPEQILGYLLKGEEIFPRLNWLEEMNKKQEGSFRDFVTTMRFDINNNLGAPDKSQEKIDKEKIYETYRIYLNLSILPFLHRLFVEGIKREKITFEHTLKFFIDHTWLAQELIEFDASNDVVKYNWLSLIASSLHEYFFQMESALKSNTPYTNFVMPIDSLTTKFEGILRDFVRLQNISTTISGKGNVLREKYIEELLDDDVIKEYFNEDDRLFFNYLFVAKNGMNLRNNIAHSFYKYKNYSFQIVHLLICAMLRIGKYKMTVNEKEPSPSPSVND